MTRIRIAPEAVRRAGLQTVTVAGDHHAVVSMLNGLGLPAMPSDMQRAYEARIRAAAAQVRATAARQDGLGVDLQLRATAAEAADSGSGEPSASAGQRVSAAVGAQGSIVDADGAPVAVTVAVTGGLVTASAATGATATVDPRGLARTAKAEAEPPVERASTAGGETRAGHPAAAPDAAEPRGGLAATSVRDAVTGGGPAGAGAPTAGTAGLMDDTITPPAGGEIAAERHDGRGGVPVRTEVPEPGLQHAPQDWACWMAGRAAHVGLPPELPLMMALARSGLRNTAAAGEGSGSGFFALDAAGATAPAGYGLPPSATPGEDWWLDHPGAQLDHVLGGLAETGGGIRGAGLDSGDSLGRWAADAFGQTSAEDYAGAHESASQLVDACKQTAPAVGSAGPATDGLAAAQRELGVHEVGANTGPEVDRYLASASAGPGNPWCAAFVTWSLAQSGTEMPGTGWAAVANWVHAAQAGQHGLEIVDAAHARPGDIVAYDWGGGGDFGSDGHIGFLESAVGEGGRFTTVEGNSGDAVSRMQRSLGSGNPVFIRVGG